MAETDKYTTAGRRSWRSLFWFLVGFVTGPIILNAGFILLGYLLAPPAQDMDDAEKVVGPRIYDYLMREGHTNRGPRFWALVAALDNMRWEGADLSRDTVKAYLGPPDLTHEEGNVVTFGYLYRDAQGRQRVADLTFRNRRLVCVGYGAPPVDDPTGDERRMPQS